MNCFVRIASRLFWTIFCSPLPFSAVCYVQLHLRPALVLVLFVPFSMTFVTCVPLSWNSAWNRINLRCHLFYSNFTDSTVIIMMQFFSSFLFILLQVWQCFNLFIIAGFTKPIGNVVNRFSSRPKILRTMWHVPSTGVGCFSRCLLSGLEAPDSLAGSSGPYRLLTRALMTVLLLFMFIRIIAKSGYYVCHACLSVRPPTRLEQLGSHWTRHHEILYLSIFRKSAEKSFIETSQE